MEYKKGTEIQTAIQTYLILLPHFQAVLMTSLIGLQTAGHKMAAFTVVFL